MTDPLPPLLLVTNYSNKIIENKISGKNGSAPKQIRKTKNTERKIKDLIKTQRRASLAAPTRVQLADFELLKKIGQGGFGEVYLCRKKDTGEILALKIMEKSFIWTRNKKRQVKNERDVLAQGAHDHIVRLHYSFQDPHYLYLAMEYCPGGDLYHLINSFNRLEEDEARLYVAEMIVAVTNLHNMGYIHRDLKPDNFLIDSKGHLKLADFGLSKEGLRHYAEESPCFPGSSGRTEEKSFRHRRGIHSVVGSPEYMAPEVLSREGYGKEVDWWSLGCLIFAMIVGYPPFTGNNPQEVFNNILSWKIVLPKIMAYHQQLFSEELIDLLMGFLCEPDRRMGHDLELMKRHNFFSNIDWDNLKNLPPLFVPKLENEYDISYFDDPNPTSPTFRSPPLNPHTSNFRGYYNTCLLKHKEKLSNPLQVQLERLHRSRSLDASQLHAYNIPAWVTPAKGRMQIYGDGVEQMTLTRPRPKPLHLVTPPKEPHHESVSPTPEKQILGFTFQRKQTSRTIRPDLHQLPTLQLSQPLVDDIFSEEDEEKENHVVYIYNN